MRKLICAAVATLAMASPAAAENWHFVAENDSSLWYMDIDSITTSGDVKSATIVEALFDPLTDVTPNGYYVRAAMNFKCAANSLSVDNVVIFDIDRNETSSEIGNPTPYETVVANTPASKASDIVCGRTTANEPVSNPYDDADLLIESLY